MDWETAADGLPVRTEADAKAELLRLNLEVMHADTFQRNDAHRFSSAESYARWFFVTFLEFHGPQCHSVASTGISSAEKLD